MKLTIHRGAKTIGGTCIELASEGWRLFLDLGLPLMHSDGTQFDFKEEDQSAAELIEQGILPDLEGIYTDQPRDDRAAVLLSHAHRDHWGLMGWLHPETPVWSSSGTIRLLNVTALFVPTVRLPATIHEFKMWQPFRFGPFTITPYLADHSAPDAASFLIESDKGRRVFYSGDIRAHGRKGVVFERLLKDPPRDVDALLLEGTMLGRDGPQEFANEQAIEEELVKLARPQDRTIFFFCSSQNIDRVCSAYRAAKRTDSIFVIDLYTACVLDQLNELFEHIPHPDWGPTIRVRYWRSHAQRLDEAGNLDLVYRLKKSQIKDEELAANANRAIILAKSNTLFDIEASRLPEKQTIELVWSMWDGYLNGEDRISRFAAAQGIEIKRIHTSGHAVIEDLQRLARAIQPAKVIPIHTLEPARYVDYFENVEIVKDGESILL